MGKLLLYSFQSQPNLLGVPSSYTHVAEHAPLQNLQVRYLMRRKRKMCIAFSFYYIWGCSCSYVLFVQCQIVYVSIHVSCRSSDTNVKADQKISTRRKIFSDSSTLFAGEQQERHGGKKFLIFLFTFPEFFVKRTFKNWTNLNTMEWTRKVNSGQAPANGKRLRVQTNTSCSREFIWLHRFQFFSPGCCCSVAFMKKWIRSVIRERAQIFQKQTNEHLKSIYICLFHDFTLISSGA